MNFVRSLKKLAGRNLDQRSMWKLFRTKIQAFRLQSIVLNLLFTRQLYCFGLKKLVDVNGAEIFFSFLFFSFQVHLETKDECLICFVQTAVKQFQISSASCDWKTLLVFLLINFFQHLLSIFSIVCSNAPSSFPDHHFTCFQLFRISHFPYYKHSFRKGSVNNFVSFFSVSTMVQSRFWKHHTVPYWIVEEINFDVNI